MAHWLCRFAFELLVGRDEKVGQDGKAANQDSTWPYSARNLLQSRIGLE
jgi:hypothetical protein